MENCKSTGERAEPGEAGGTRSRVFRTPSGFEIVESEVSAQETVRWVETRTAVT